MSTLLGAARSGESAWKEARLVKGLLREPLAAESLALLRVARKNWVALALCEAGHAALAAGESAAGWLAQARTRKA